MASLAPNQALQEVVSHLAVFFPVTLFGKQWGHRRPWGEFPGSWAGGGGRGLVQTLVVTGCPERGATGGQKVAQRKGNKPDQRVQTQAVDVWGGGMTRHTAPFSHSGAAWPDLPAPSQIFICSEPPPHREGAPEQILTSSKEPLMRGGPGPGQWPPSAAPAWRERSASQ